MTPSDPVAKRLVLVFPGFEPLPVEAHVRRFLREAAISARTFEVDLSLDRTGTEAAPGISVETLHGSAAGAGWRTESDIVIYGLGDLDALYSQRPDIVRFATGLVALLDFIVTGTLFRFLRTSWRYGLFFLFPLLLATIIIAASLLALWLPPSTWGAIHLVWSVPLAVAILLGGIKLGKRHAHLLLIMDDWNFARDVARGGRRPIEDRLDAVVSDACARVAFAGSSEIVFAAHSFGAIAAMRALSACLARTPQTQVGVMTVGSSLMKVALHPAAAKLRDAAAAVMAASVPWLDVQSLTDPINFYNSDPARDLGIASGRPALTTRVRFRDQLLPDTYKAIRRDFFRVHRQFVYGIERRHSYSFHMILLGPVPFPQVVASRGLPASFVSGAAA